MKHNPDETWPKTSRELRQFAIGIAIALNVLAGILYWHGGTFPFILTILAVMLLLPLLLDLALGTKTLRVLGPLNALWKVFTKIINAVVSTLVLFLTLVLLFGSIKAINRIRGQSFLELSIDPSTKSYWKRRNPEPFDPSRCEKQY